MASHIAAVGLGKSYWKGPNEVPVLRGVDLEAERGEMVAVVGASGSGKSTLLHILGLLDAPDAGTVLVDSQRIDNRPERHRDAMRNRLFGFIFQFYHLLPELTALENVMMPNLIRHGALVLLEGAAADPPRGGGVAGTRGSGASARSSPHRALRRRDAADGDRSGPGRPSINPAGRRTDRKP